jgi:hypothetical protein
VVPRTRPAPEIQAVFDLKSRGKTDHEVSDLTGVPVDTIRTWRKRQACARIQRALHPEGWCGTCGDRKHELATVPANAYSYLLGVYLGDGCITRWGGKWILRIALDDAYPGIVADCCAAIAAIHGGERPRIRADKRGQHCVYVESAWRQWPCLFPQHGRGRKHLRKIELADWQQPIVDAEPEAFLRGLIHTDGWRGLNRVNVKGKDYAYPRYQFSNRSDDIRKLFTDACDRLGVAWRQWTRFHISVARRDSVALLDTFIGPKE